MNRRGAIALEALIASGQILLLAATVTAMLSLFWQSWHGATEASHQRQWSTATFAYFEEDLAMADRVVVSPTLLKILTPEGDYVYCMTGDKSFYRGQGSAFYPLAKVDSVNWQLEGDLLWLELIFPDESYGCYFYLGGKR